MANEICGLYLFMTFMVGEQLWNCANFAVSWPWPKKSTCRIAHSEEIQALLVALVTAWRPSMLATMAAEILSLVVLEYVFH